MDVVLGHVRRVHRRGSREARALELRFGRGTVDLAAVAAAAGLSPKRVRSLVGSTMRGVPPPPDAGPLPVLHLDAQIAVVAKPPGVPVTPMHRLRPGSALNRLVARLPPGAPPPHPCHRLDLNTSGALVFARSPAAARVVMSQFEERTVRKWYAALCEGCPPSGVVDRPVARVPGAGGTAVRRCVDAGTEGALDAQTELHVVAATPPGAPRTRSLVIARPRQGRTHQVRLHCSEVGAPLIGDELYGRRCPAGSGHVLHALAVEFEHPAPRGSGTPGHRGRRRLRVAAPLPEAFLEVMREAQMAPVRPPGGDGRPDASRSWADLLPAEVLDAISLAERF